MSKKVKIVAVRAVRKSAHLSRKVLSVGANYSGKIENKAHRIINGTDQAIKLHDQVLFEKYYYEAMPYILPLHPALPKAGRKGKVTLFIPSLQKSSFFGGTATALIFAGLLAQKKGLEIKVVETLKHGKSTAEELSTFYGNNDISISSEHIEMVDVSPRKYNNYGYIEMHPDDIFVVSAWWDAYVVERLPLQNKFIYMIQDYEPIFYSNSDKYILAESTYHSEKFTPVCNTEFMRLFMEKEGYDYIAKNALVFEPAMNVGKRLGSSIKKKQYEKKRMFLYGRPSVERNLFLTGISAINSLFLDQQLDSSEWEIYMAGQDGITNIQLESGIVTKNLGKLTIDEYYEFAKTIDVAVSLMMAPHPSYPPLELASTGAMVVTTQYKTKQNLSAYSENIITVPIEIEAIKHAILRASKITYEQRIQNTKKATLLGTDWKKSLSKVLNQL